MAASSLAAALEHVFAHEGGYVDHPRDPGGATNMGITRRTLAGWRGRAVTKAEVKAMTRTEAAAIYRARFWNAVRADDLPAGVDACVFDAAVHSGPSRAVRWLQAELGVRVDGVIGPKTLAAAGELPPERLVAGLCRRRLRFMQGLKTWPTFGRGWARRMKAVEREALSLARRGAAAARPKEITMSDTKHWYESKTVWGAVVTIIALVASAAGVTLGSERAGGPRGARPAGRRARRRARGARRPPLGADRDRLTTPEIGRHDSVGGRRPHSLPVQPPPHKTDVMIKLLHAAALGCLVLMSPPAQAACGIDIAAAVRDGGAQDFSALRGQVAQSAAGQIVDVSLCEEGGQLVYRVLVVPQVANAQARLVRVDAQSGAVLN